MYVLRFAAILSLLALNGGCSSPTPPQAPAGGAPPKASSSQAAQASAPAVAGKGAVKPQSLADASSNGAKAAQSLGAPSPGDGASQPFWPRFHGPNGDNISTDTGLLKSWPDEGPRLVWTADGLGEGYSSVSIANGMIYTAGNKGGNTTVFAMDLNGKAQWEASNGPAWTRDYPGTRGTPTIDGDRVYHESPLGEVVCLNAKNGEQVWRRNILKDFEAQNLQWALAESILIDGDRAICSPGGPKASVVALDKKTGQTVWAAKPTGHQAGYATPVLAEQQGLRMILAMTAKSVIAVNADSGELLWEHPHETDYDVNATSPVHHQRRVFVTSGYKSPSEMLEVTVEGGKATAKKVWEAKQLNNQHGGVVLLEGFLYGSSHRGTWDCLDWEKGEKQFSERGVGKGSLTYADGLFYMLAENRQMGLVEASPKGLKVINKFKLPTQTPGNSWAHPVVCGGRLYVRHAEQLFAFDVKAK